MQGKTYCLILLLTPAGFSVAGCKKVQNQSETKSLATYQETARDGTKYSAFWRSKTDQNYICQGWCDHRFKLEDKTTWPKACQEHLRAARASDLARLDPSLLPTIDGEIKDGDGLEMHLRIRNNDETAQKIDSHFVLDTKELGPMASSVPGPEGTQTEPLPSVADLCPPSDPSPGLRSVEWRRECERQAQWGGFVTKRLAVIRVYSNSLKGGPFYGGSVTLYEDANDPSKTFTSMGSCRSIAPMVCGPNNKGYLLRADAKRAVLSKRNAKGKFDPLWEMECQANWQRYQL